ncbi:acyl carrier protein [Paenibacillaceae bacterium WGS1546]|uniref:acyl carrier protein n=1 Tax=Cohnella sp. WGS1546 TaxID=3366810 RepID=UPI00372CFB57
MTIGTIESQVLEIVAAVLKVDDERKAAVTEDTPLHTIGFDSLNCVEVIVVLEEHFGIMFEDEELMIDQLNTVRKLTDIINVKRG